MSKKRSITEQDVAAPVVAWLKADDWEVYQEVSFSSYGGVADIVAVKGGIMWIIEVKKSFTLSVAYQAAHWPVHKRSIAVPDVKGNSGYKIRQWATSMIRNYAKVGTIVVRIQDISRYTYETSVKEESGAPVMKGKYIKSMVDKYRGILTEAHKTWAKAGKANGGYLTPYKVSMAKVRLLLLECHPEELTARQITDKLGMLHYASISSARESIRRALTEIEASWCITNTDLHPLRFSARKDMAEKTREADELCVKESPRNDCPKKHGISSESLTARSDFIQKLGLVPGRMD